MPEIDFYLNDFFVLEKFQNQGLGNRVAIEMFDQLKGRWAVGVIPENIKAIKFWCKTISKAANWNYREVFKTADELRNAENPDPYAKNVFTFDTNHKVISAKDDISIRLSQASDIQRIVEMSYQKRRLYEKAQPQFWKYAGDIAELSQAKWFEELLGSNDHIMLAATSHQKIVGFIIGKLMPAYTRFSRLSSDCRPLPES